MDISTGPSVDTMDFPPSQPQGAATGLVFVPRRLFWCIPLVLLCAIVGFLLGSVLLRHVTPRFTSSVLIVIDPKRPGVYGADAEFASVYVDAAKVASVETVLTSSELLQDVVDTLHLADEPVFSRASPSRLAQYLPFLVSTRPPTSPDSPALRRARAVVVLRRMVSTTRVNATYIIKVDVTAPNAALAQRAVQTLADSYIASLTEAKMQASRRDFMWLTDRLKQQRSDLVQSDVAVEAIKRRFGVMSSDNSTDISIDRQSVKQADEDLVRAQGDVAATQAKLSQAQSVLQSHGRLENLPDIADSPAIGLLRKAKADADQVLAEASVRYGTGHPLYRQAEHNRQTIQMQLSAEISRALDTLRNQAQTAVAHRDNLAQNVARLMSVINATANAEGRVELREAERLAEANRVAYEASLNRLRDVEQQQTRIDAEARILSGAERPEFPSSPKPLIFLGGGAGVGLLLGGGIAALLSIQRRRIDDAAAAERDFLLPVLANIPDVRRCGEVGRGMAIPEYLLLNPFSLFADSLRLLRFHLRSVVAGQTKVIQITSAVPGEGKSTIASSLAISAASAGIRTILIDLDLHQSTAGRLLGHAHGEGVIDVLTGRVDTESVVQTDKRLPVRVINAGSLAALHPGMIEGRALRDLITKLRADCDLVIIDTPPVLAISDPLYVSALVDATILVVAWRSTPRVFVDNALCALRAAHAPMSGIVLNRVDSSRLRGYDDKRYHTETNVIRLAPAGSRRASLQNAS